MTKVLEIYGNKSDDKNLYFISFKSDEIYNTEYIDTLSVCFASNSFCICLKVCEFYNFNFLNLCNSYFQVTTYNKFILQKERTCKLFFECSSYLNNNKKVISSVQKTKQSFVLNLLGIIVYS